MTTIKANHTETINAGYEDSYVIAPEWDEIPKENLVTFLGISIH